VQEEKAVEPHPAAAVPETFRNAVDAQRWLAAPEMTERLKMAEERFNAALPQMNAVMASNPMPGRASVPLKPLKEGELQRAVSAAAAGGGQAHVQQFEAIRQWQTALLEKLTNGEHRVTK
jgi:hypothetical protein